MSKALTLRRIIIALLLAATVWCGVRTFYVPAEYSRAFSHVPDSVENTLAMKNLMEGHGFTLRLNGVDHPSRYQPWFSLMFVGPALLFARGNVLCSWYGCFAAGVGALFAAFAIGRKLGGSFCGLILSAVLAVFADFARYTNVTMTEVPYTMLLLFAALVWLKLCERRETRVSEYLRFGVLCALAGALRSTALMLPALVLLPLRKHRPERKTTLSALAAAWLPPAAVTAANAVYNKLTFGEFFRSGYHYWAPVEYDYFDITFNWRYIGRNLRDYVSSCNLLFLLLPALAGAVCWFFLRRRDREKARAWEHFAVFIAAITAVNAGVYLPYFSFQERFFLPIRTLAMLGGAAAAALLASTFFRRRGAAALGLAALAIAFAPWPDPHDEQLVHDCLRSADIYLLRKMRDTLPENAVLLTIFPQGAAEYFFVGNSSRRIIPFFRCYEYAQMVTTKYRIPPPPGGFRNMELAEANRYIAAHGGIRPYPLVYSEAPEEIDKLIGSGIPVYISGYTLLIHPHARKLEHRYNFVCVGETEDFAFFRLLRK